MHEDKEDLNTEIKSDLRDSIKTNLKKGENLHKPFESEPLEKNVDAIRRESI